MGTRGPIPNRSDDYSRPQDANRSGDRPPVTKGKARGSKAPNAPRDWHPIARKLWDSLKNSGQSDFYEESDWAYAYHVMDDLSRYKAANKRSSMMFQAIDSALARLLVTEGDRRRARIELEAEEPEQMSVGDAAILDYRSRLAAVPDEPLEDAN